jgi:hypothetical protein
MPESNEIDKGGSSVVRKEPLYVPPSFKPPECSYPPYCSSRSMKVWRVATVTVGVEPATDPEKELIEKWVTQLVRGQLGEALGEAEKNQDTRLHMSLNVEAVALISAALKLRNC